MKVIQGKTITFEMLVEMFQGIEKQVEMIQDIDEKAQWDTSKDMLWGYFFTHSEPHKLEQAAGALTKRQYKVVNIYLSDKEDPNDPDKFWLHVEKIETHTPESLDKRNDELYTFANELSLDCYDGMDVGPVSQ